MQKRNLVVFLSQYDLTVSKMQQIIEYLDDDASINAFKKTKFPESILSREQFDKMLDGADENLVLTYHRI